MLIFIKLLFAHLLGDFLFQPDSWVKEKNELKHKSKKLYYHIGVHILLMLIVLWDIKLLPIILLIALSHYLIDLGKLSIQNDKNARWIFTADQILHLIVLLFAAEKKSPFIDKIAIDIPIEQIFILALCILIVTAVSAKVIKIMISKWTPETEDKDEDSLSNAGSYIGILERLFVFGFVITNNIQAVGFLLAAKSVFRFGDLKESKDRKLTEYILIGTLLSFGIAIIVGLFYAYLFDIQLG
ncbi:MAG: DUF3307 domain-containing protein [Saprospiraceae bacterium]|nr:DUF3307 domain-containing protein [Saprospiraceae bacterium]